MDFQQAFASQIPQLRPFRQRQANFVLSLPDDDPRKQQFFLHAEARARRHLGYGDGEVDWAEGAVNTGVVTAAPINWQAIIAFLMAELPKLMAIFGC